MAVTQLFLFDPVDVPLPRVRPVVDKELRRRRKLARERWQASVRILPVIELFISSGGEKGAYSPLDPRPEHESQPLTRAEKIEKRRRLKANRKADKPKVKTIFTLCDLLPEWIRDEDLAAMDAEIERARAEVQACWSDNERRKRLRGINADERDPLEHWTPPFAPVCGGNDNNGDD